MNENPLVSIIITTCKREMDILERAVKSAIGQTYENREILIINDCPEYFEKIEVLLKKYPGVNLIGNEGKHGVSHVRNLGLESAKGEFIAFLDDDDEWLPEKTEKQTAVIDDNTGLVYCEIKAIKDGIELKTDSNKEYPEGEVFGKLLGDNFVGGCSSVLFRKKAAVDAGGFDPELSFGEDHDLWLRIAKNNDVRAVKEKLVKYYIGHESLTGSFERRIAGWEYLLEKYAEDYSHYPKSYGQFTSTMVREAAKRGSLGYSLGIWKKYGKTAALIKGIVMKIMMIY
ncbi:MAG: glycosyltransferase family 2 protein [Lachnospiraceae bacterium]|nr:glycosyltransferase family 2 protein [Lachnospiraceae bacterium]